jgi:hypothetical protein
VCFLSSLDQSHDGIEIVECFLHEKEERPQIRTESKIAHIEKALTADSFSTNDTARNETR